MYPPRCRLWHAVNGMRLLAAHPNLDNRRVVLYKQTHRLPSQLPHAREIPHSVVFLECNCFGGVGFSLHIAPLSTEIARRHLHFTSSISISSIQIEHCRICVALKGNRFALGRKQLLRLSHLAVYICSCPILLMDRVITFEYEHSSQ